MLYTSLRGVSIQFLRLCSPSETQLQWVPVSKATHFVQASVSNMGVKGRNEGGWGEGILLQCPSTLAMQMVHWLCKLMTTWTDLRGWGRGTTVGIQSGNKWQRILNCNSLVYSLIVYAAINPVTRPWSHRYYFLTVAESYWSLVCFATDSCVCLKFPNILH